MDEFPPQRRDPNVLSPNPNYRGAGEGKPAFAKVTFKGGGDAAAAGRSVMETGEFDYAWNLQLAPDVIASDAGRWQRHTCCGLWPNWWNVMMLNNTNPDPADLGPDERSVVRPHPLLG